MLRLLSLCSKYLGQSSQVSSPRSKHPSTITQAFIASNNDVIVVEVESGCRKQLLTHPAKVVSLYYAFSNKVITYTVNGTEYLWSTDTWTILCCRELNCLPVSVWHSNETTLVVTRNEDRELIVTKINESKVLQKQEILRTGPHNIRSSQFAVTTTYFVCCEKLFIYLYTFGEIGVKRFKYIGRAEFMDSSLLEFMSIAALGDTVASAISFGRVFIWNNVSQKGISTFTHSVHWHKWAPCLALSESNTLFSGGDEGVLAKFALSESKSIAKPQLLPRLQAPVRRLNLSEDGSIVIVVLADNSAHFILNSTLNVLSSVESILCSPKKPLFPLTEDPAYTSYVVHSARPGIVQWIKPSTMTSVATADISRENPVEGENIFSDTKGYTDVCGVALSQTVVVTADCNVGFGIPNNRLQFWRRNKDLGSLALECRELYTNGIINFIRACFEYDMFITADNKGVLCTWEKIQEKKWYKSNEIHWMGVPILHMSRIRKLHFAAIHDITGKVNGVVALWCVEQKKIPRIVHVHQGNGKLGAVEWGPLNNASLLIISSKSCIYAFNVCTFTPMWIVCEPNLKLAVTSEFTVAYKENAIFVIDSTSGTLLCQKKLNSIPESVIAVGEDRTFTVIAAYEKGYGVVARSELLEEAQNEMHKKNTASKKTPFSNLLIAGKKNVENDDVPTETPSDLEIFSGPAYSLAPIPYLAQKFIRSCLLLPQ
uniref:Anaphase-promoting complex subunit 4 WD40 domain-containing protein n=1 Tax=Setaria digitata TaxID=48799 RepID=A0A915PZM9_9BILA